MRAPIKPLAALVVMLLHFDRAPTIVRRRNSITATAEPVSFFHPCLIATWTCRHTRSGCRSGVSVLQDPTRIGPVCVRDLRPGISERNKISEEHNSLPIERWRV
ncbi:hypothetical protein ACFX2H_033978 [Malus domestica]